MTTLSSSVFSNPLFEEMTAGGAVLAASLRAVEINRAFTEIIGVDRERLLAQSVEAFEELAPLTTHLQAIQSEETNGEEAKTLGLTRSHGETRWVQVRAWVVNHDGNAMLQVLLEDRTELEGLLAQARFSERGFQDIIEYAPDGIAIHRDNKFLYINPAFVEKLGVEHSDDVLGRTVYDFVHPDERPFLQERVLRMLATGEHVPIRETVLLRADGSEWLADLTGRMVLFGGEPAIASIARDITEKRRLAARMMQMDRMIAAGTLASGVGHEINNPLSYISTNIDFSIRRLEKIQSTLAGYREDSDRPANLESLSEQLELVQEALGDAVHGSDRIKDIVKKLGMFASDGEEKLGIIPVEPLIESVLGMVTGKVEVEVEVVTEGEGPFRIHGVYDRVARLFFNLLLNAVHAGDGTDDIHRVRVEISRDDRWVRVEIEDNGCGISKDQLARIFDPFFTTKPVGKGTGLGLYICQQIVEAHEGRIEVESTPGEGALFRVLLPPRSI